MKTIPALLTAAALTASTSLAAAPAPGVRNVVLVHGAFADGSGWQPVAEILEKDGYTVSIVQEPETSFAQDVTATTRVLDGLQGRAVLVGHSYGGAIITQAGNDPHVASLVYVAAFVPDEGDTILSQIEKAPPAATSIAPTPDGYLLVDPARFPADFAADLPGAQAHFMAISQVPWNKAILTTPITAPAWKSKPAYGIVARQDRMINPDLERQMYRHAGASVTEIKGSHAVFISQPRAVAEVIERAARAST